MNVPKSYDALREVYKGLASDNERLRTELAMARGEIEQEKESAKTCLYGLRAELAMASEVLREVEWTSRYDLGAGAMIDVCPCCCEWREHGHTDGCKLKKALGDE